MVRTMIGDIPVPTMCDGGAGLNTIPEELVLAIMNACSRAGIKLGDKRHPILAFEKKEEEEQVTGVAKSAGVSIPGAVIMRITMPSTGNSKKRKEDQSIHVRLMIFEKGKSEWRGIILGAKALDCAERGGLGFKPGQNFHVFESLGIMMDRMEDNDREQDPGGVYSLNPAVGALRGSGTGGGALRASGEFEYKMFPMRLQVGMSAVDSDEETEPAGGMQRHFRHGRFLLSQW